MVDSNLGRGPLSLALLALLQIFPWLNTEQAAAAEPLVGIVSRYLNVEAPTMGGMQVWSDIRVRHDWRIQRNVLTGHCRLLDEHNVRRRWGTKEQCLQELDLLAAKQSIPAVRGRVVITLHGLGSTRRGLEPIGEKIREQGDFTVLNVSYASTRGDFAAHAATLREVLDGLEDVEQFNFVCHSMGNLVLRYCLGECREDESGRRILARLNRIVMLAPPNNGAQLAERFKNVTILEPLVGAAATRLAREGKEFTTQLARPDCEFGIIAGAVGDDAGHNPLLSGDDDLIVRVEETRLPGARDFVTVPTRHRSLLYDEKVHAYTLRFLTSGFFVGESERAPISK